MTEPTAEARGAFAPIPQISGGIAAGPKLKALHTDVETGAQTPARYTVQAAVDGGQLIFPIVKQVGERAVGPRSESDVLRSAITAGGQAPASEAHAPFGGLAM